MQTLVDNVLKCIMLTEVVPKSNGIWEKRIRVVIISGMTNKVRQGMLFSSKCIYRNKICFCWSEG